jgi:hypothetical protein
MKKAWVLLLCSLLTMALTPVHAWSNHSFSSYRSFEKMPEIAQAAPVKAEPLEAFLKAEEKAIANLLASQEVWAKANLTVYPPRPDILAFSANTARTDDARRLAFLMALRVAPNSKLALYVQPDPWSATSTTQAPLPHAAVNTLPEQANSSYRFTSIKPGELVAPLNVLASATDEPDYGLDINLWQDSPSDWGKVFGFGDQSFGNPALTYSTQAPFHMGFYHEAKVIYMAAPFIKKTFPLLRVHQFTGLATLAFKTGHPYWGWRFTGLALHYVQDLTQPYHSTLSPGDSSAKLIGINVLAMAGMPKMKDNMIVLLSNRHLALEKYQNQMVFNAARNRQETSLEKQLRAMDKDASYPVWSDNYSRDVVSRQAYDYASKLTEILLDSLPPGYVSDPSFDFGVKEAEIDLVANMSSLDAKKRKQLDNAVGELLVNFGAHSRNVVRGILKASAAP